MFANVNLQYPMRKKRRPMMFEQNKNSKCHIRI
jgi:hypothetical protein